MVRPERDHVTRDEGALFQIVALGQSDFRELRRAQVGFVRAEEFVELRRLDRRAGEHRVRLAAMVDLVLEEMREEPRRAFLHDARAPRHGDRPGEIGVGQRRAQGDEPAIDRVLRDGRAPRRCRTALRARKSGRTEVRRLAVEAPLQRIDVIPVDGQDCG